MTRKGDPTPGSFSDVGTFQANSDVKVFDAIFQRIGITTCNTNPADLQGAEGFLEYIRPDRSQVVNPAGSRATFGYFIRGTALDSSTALEWFALFSYDRIVVSQNGQNRAFCATEFFLFGSFRRQADGMLSPDPLPLLLGLAIDGSDGSGCLLTEVPMELALVSNFLSGHPGELVKPGVDFVTEGCLLCHGRDKEFPETTLPFPWVALPPMCPGAALDGGNFPAPCARTLAAVPGAYALAVGANEVYVASPSGVSRLSKDGGTPIPLSTLPAFDLVADTSGGFWLEDSLVAGRLIAATGGAPTLLLLRTPATTSIPTPGWRWTARTSTSR